MYIPNKKPDTAIHTEAKVKKYLIRSFSTGNISVLIKQPKHSPHAAQAHKKYVRKCIKIGF